MAAEGLKLIDKAVGTPFCVLLGWWSCLTRLFRKLPQPSQCQRLLLIKTVAIGDIVVILPTIKAIRALYPKAYLAMLSTPRVRELLEGNPHLDEIIYYDVLGEDKGLRGLLSLIKRLRQKNLDMVIDLEHYYRFTTLLSYLAGAQVRIGFELPWQGRKYLFTQRIPYAYGKHEVETFLEIPKALGAKVEKPQLEPIPTSLEDKHWVESFLRSENLLGEKLLIGLHPGTSQVAKARRWMPERWAKVGDILASQFGAEVIFTGASEDHRLVESIVKLMETKPSVSTGRTTLKQFAEFTKSLALFISVDTGPMHIAAAMGTPVVGLFGPNTPVKWAPYGEKIISIYKPISCSPCTRQYLGQVSKCKRDDCMREITVEDVISAAGQIIRETKPK